MNMPEALPETVVSRVLLVEDDAKLADLIQTYLKDYDIQVIKEARGDRALDQVHKRQPDLVVLDVMLPGKNGSMCARKCAPRGLACRS